MFCLFLLRLRFHAFILLRFLIGRPIKHRDSVQFQNSDFEWIASRILLGILYIVSSNNNKKIVLNFCFRDFPARARWIVRVRDYVGRTGMWMRCTDSDCYRRWMKISLRFNWIVLCTVFHSSTYTHAQSPYTQFSNMSINTRPAQHTMRSSEFIECIPNINETFITHL